MKAESGKMAQQERVLTTNSDWWPRFDPQNTRGAGRELTSEHPHIYIHAKWIKQNKTKQNRNMLNIKITPAFLYFQVVRATYRRSYLIKLLKAADCGLMQRGTLFPFCCSRMNWWINFLTCQTELTFFSKVSSNLGLVTGSKSLV